MSAMLSNCFRSVRPVFLKRCRLSLLRCAGNQNIVPDIEQRPDESFDGKNARLNRPLSPHLTIYKFQLTSVLSITHRMTGLAVAGGLYGLSIGMLVLPASFPYYMAYLGSLGIASPVIYSLKFSLAWMFVYHMLNGIRHLAWDLGYGFELKQLYTSGYIVLASSLIIAAVLAAL